MANSLEPFSKKYFEAPPYSWNYRDGKNVLVPLDFQHNEIKEPLCVDQDLRRKGLTYLTTEEQFNPVRNKKAFRLVSLLKDYGKQKDVDKGSELHAYIRDQNFLESNCYIASALISMYSKCGELAKAQQVFDLVPMPLQNVVMWNALIAGYAQQGHGEEALEYFNSMQLKGQFPDVASFTTALKACGSIGAATMGERIHHKIVSLGLLEESAVIGNALVYMYVKCCVLTKAQEMFDKLPVRDVVTWNTLIAGYAQQAQGKEALERFDSMQHDGHFPDAITFTCTLSSCGSIGAFNRGEQIHCKVVSLGLLEIDKVLGSALVSMYAKCGALAVAQRVLNGLCVRDMVSWTAMIAGYIQQGEAEEALKCFECMQYEGHCPDAVSFSCGLKACGSIGAVSKGEQIHDKIASLGLLETNVVLGNTLVDMYASCGSLPKAQQVFRDLSFRDVVSWTILVSGYAQTGQAEEAFNCFERMQSNGIMPNKATLVCVLNACSHAGLADQALIWLSSMSTKHVIIPEIEHCGCMIDLFGRAGMFYKALELIQKVQSADDELPIWLALLGACCKWGDGKTGKLAFSSALHIDRSNAGAYVCMGNIHTAVGM